MAVTSNGAAPYAPPSAVVEIITRFRDRGMETPFTNDVLMRAGVTESLAPRTLQALKLIDLIDEAGNPAEGFLALAEAPSSEYQNRLAEIVQAAYEPIFRFADPATDPIEQVEDAFRGCTPRGQRPRMVSLFYGLCEEAGLISEVPNRQPGSSRSKAEKPERPSTTSARRTASASNGKTRTPMVGLPSPLVGMLEALPESWEDRSERDDWLTLFTAALDYSVKIRPTGSNEQEVSS